MAAFADPLADVSVELHAPVDPPAPVVGGAPVPEGTWPDVAALYTVGDQFACSGVLIAPDLVLTAGHCGYGIGHVVVGTSDLHTGGEAVAVVDTLVHEDYLRTIDAAVLTLEHPVTDVAPRVLARDCVIEDDLFAGADVAIVGFGAIDLFATEWTSVLHEADTTVGDPECVDFSTGCNEDVSPGGELTAGGGGVDSCSGDSGGPLYLLVGDQPADDYLVGITSRATTPADTVCGDGGIYVRADAIAAWIEASLGIVLPRPACDGNQPPEPVADELVAVVDETARVSVDPNDPDPDQSWSYTILTPPAHGVATVGADGMVEYDATDAPLGFDSVTVKVTDDGAPPRTGAVPIQIHVVPVAPGTDLQVAKGCGCDSSAGAPWIGAAALLLVRRRRNSSTRLRRCGNSSRRNCL